MDERTARENLLWTLERLAEKATAGPWFSQGGLIHAPDKGGIDVGALRAEVFEDEPWSNATYIVALLNAAPELIAALRAATADKPLTGLDMPKCVLDHDHGQDEGDCVYEGDERLAADKPLTGRDDATLEAFRPKNDDTFWLRIAVNALLQTGPHIDHVPDCPVAHDVSWVINADPLRAATADKPLTGRDEQEAPPFPLDKALHYAAQDHHLSGKHPIQPWTACDYDSCQRSQRALRAATPTAPALDVERLTDIAEMALGEVTTGNDYGRYHVAFKQHFAARLARAAEYAMVEERVREAHAGSQLARSSAALSPTTETPKPAYKPKYGHILPLPENVDPLTDREYLRIQAHNERIYQAMEADAAATETPE